MPMSGSLVLYHSLLETPQGAAMAAFLNAASQGEEEATAAYLRLVRTMYAGEAVPGPKGDAWQDFLLHCVLSAENAFTHAASGGFVPAALREAAAWDLRILERLFRLSGPRCLAIAGGIEEGVRRAAERPGLGLLDVERCDAGHSGARSSDTGCPETGRLDTRPSDTGHSNPGRRRAFRAPGDSLPTWSGQMEEDQGPHVAPGFRDMARRMAEADDWAGLVDQLAEFHREHGCGVVACSWFLTWDGRRLQAVEQPDLVDLDDLAGLVDQKQAVLENTEAFLRGGAGQNLLLYGPRGTGKSSLVRALAPRYGGAGLRLVEVTRERLGSLGELYRIVRRHPQRFILFLDDLTFEADDSDYRAFKSLLEGALERRPPNLVLYVTSNRRHMVPERWSDRNSPEEAEVHGQDALEERLSLADRFGRTILFLRPDQEEYLRIVEHLAARRGLPVGREELREAARRWALWQNGLSGRAARQFVDDLEARLK